MRCTLIVERCTYVKISPKSLKLFNISDFSVMDFLVDATNSMDRSGAVYPFVRSGVLGCLYGNRQNRRQDDEESDVCNVLVESCNDGFMDWNHLETVNNYKGGDIQRTIQRNALDPDLRTAK